MDAGDASVALLGHLALTRPIGRLVFRYRLEGLAGAANRFFKANRSRLSKIVPDLEGPVRPP